MNLRICVLSSFLTMGTSWTTTKPTALKFQPYLNGGSSRSISLQATVVSEGATSPALAPQGKPIADGHVVSSFKGGLIAVRVDDDMEEILAATQSPEVVGTMTEIPGEASISSTANHSKGKSGSLGGDLIGHQVLFPNGETGVVVSHRPPMIFVYTDMETVANVEGSVKVLESLASVKVDKNLSLVDCFGRPMDGMEVKGDQQRPIFAPIPKVSDIALINTPLLTGVTMFDALAPIGKGQNMLMISHDVHDMRQYVCDMLSVQSKETKCVYASTCNSEDITSLLKAGDLLENVTLVSSRKSKDGDDPTSMAAEATVTAATACAIAESLALDKGEDTLVIIDTLDFHKSLWDATTRVLVDEFGIEAVVKGDRDGGASSEMRAFFSSLIQRSAQYKKAKGGGSVTLVLLCTIPKLAVSDEDTIFSPDDFKASPAKVQERIDLLVKRKVPLTSTNLRKIQIPVPSDSEGSRRLSLQHIDDLISMSDGQIWLDEQLEKKGRRPAMDFQRSVTRIGIGADTESRADAMAMRRVVEGLRLDLSQALDMDAADVATKASKDQARNALAWLLAMHQPSASTVRTLSESCTALLAASKGYLSDSVDGGALAGTKEGDDLMSNLLAYVKSHEKEAMSAIDDTLDMTDKDRQLIEEAIKSYFL